ncbi:Pre-mRNA cleavage complex II protein Clp1-domain containing protein [Nitzschia inconspicua]|uniref:Pre-mRNA cleavage complex II protein Clp1-domain containing protein n=1 Tax=Nitzschia inconspicua TaxID=303405 RepID=A0A9K3Q2W9_9STRA|nr:Pre-mRNA cleavage complex II protein Clp1-domain containing protein [Nitzschia inconspicua]
MAESKFDCETIAATNVPSTAASEPLTSIDESSINKPLSGTKRPFKEQNIESSVKDSVTTTTSTGLETKEGHSIDDTSIIVEQTLLPSDDNGDHEKDPENNENGEDDDEEEVFRPVYNLPEGMTIEWATDHQSATLYISDLSVSGEEAVQETRVCLVGRAIVTAEEGTAEILGCSISSSNEKDSVTLVSPFWSSWLTIQATTLPTKLRLCCIRGSDSFRIVAPTRPTVIPHEWKEAAGSMVRQFCSDGIAARFNASGALARTFLEDHAADGFRGNATANNATFDHPRQICAITGGQGVGKSTFLRYLTNRMVTNQREIAILDADVGQPELAPPGLLRLAIVRKPLLHPPYWNLARHGSGDENCKAEQFGAGMQIVSSVFFGSETSRTDPNRFVECILFLMEQYQQKIVSKSPVPIPLFINLDGWVKGLGFQVMVAILNSVRPTHLVQILGEKRAQTFDLTSDLTAEVTEMVQIYCLPACTIMSEASICRIPSLTLRNFRWAAYFLPSMLETFDAWDFVSAKDLQTGWVAASGKRFRIDGDEDQSERLLRDECRLARALARERPFFVSMDEVECLVIGSDFEDVLQVSAECSLEERTRRRNRIFQSMNGQIVSMCTNTSTMESLGCGILRSIDWKKQLLYILVPPSIPESLLLNINVLVKGALPLPLAMLYRGVFSESFPYLSSSQPTILGSTQMKSRNNIARKNFTQNTSVPSGAHNRGTQN